MQLTRTRSGKLAKKTTITAGGKWRFVANRLSEDNARQDEAIQIAKGRKSRVTSQPASKSQAKKYNIEIGTPVWRVEAYIGKMREVMVHA